MVAPAHLYRRWFIKNGTFPPGHPGADEPADGYYSSEAQAKKAQQIMVECYGIPTDKLSIAFEDVSLGSDAGTSADNPP